MPVSCPNRSRFLPRILAVGLLGLMWPSSAPAFFFFGWPGSGEAVPKSLIPPTPETFANPPSSQPPHTNKPPDNPTPETPQEHPEVPEPATGVAAVIGLAVVGFRWNRRLR